MLNQWDKEFPGRTETIFSAISKVSPSQLADTNIFDFINLSIDRSAPVTFESEYGDNKEVVGGNHPERDVNDNAGVSIWLADEDQDVALIKATNL